MNWIKVDKELPKSDEHVLITVNGWDDLTFTILAYYENNNWFNDEDIQIKKEDVTHWMELPEPAQ